MWPLLLVACSTSPPPFSCETAAELLGHPGAVAEACDPAPNAPELYTIALTGADLPSRLVVGVHVVNGAIDPVHGDKALAGFLDSLGDRRKALTMRDMMAALRAFQAFPAGFDPKVAMFDLPNIGRSDFAPEPFTLQLYNGRPPDPGFIRAVLTGPPWSWTLSELPDGATEWRETGKAPLGG